MASVAVSNSRDGSEFVTVYSVGEKGERRKEKGERRKEKGEDKQKEEEKDSNVSRLFLHSLKNTHNSP